MKKKVVLCAVLLGMLFGLAGCAEDAGQMEESGQQENPAAAQEEFAGDGAWTILVYLCGTDLESGYGAATMDLGEMLDRDFGSQVRFVVQTGGCAQWQNEVIPEDAIMRYEIKCNAAGFRQIRYGKLWKQQTRTYHVGSRWWKCRRCMSG